MHDWLKEYNLADLEPFIEAVDETRHQYFPDKLDILYDTVSIPGILQSYVLNKALKQRPECKLYAPGDPYKHKCEESCTKQNCKACKEVKRGWKECSKYQAYELLKTGMVSGPAIIFCRYHKREKTQIRSHIYGRKGKKCKCLFGYDCNAQYLYFSDQLMAYGKEKVVEVQNPKIQRNKERFNKNVLNDSLFSFAIVDSEVPEKLKDMFSEMSPFFVVAQITEVPKYMQKYREETGR